jgi:hypothetical protein
MSGQPLISPNDAARFRREYLNTLKLQSQVNERNLQANLLYNQTGVPQQPTDTRTFDEKILDIEGLKQTVRTQLLAVMDSTQANKVVQSISSSDLQYLSNRVDDIIAETQRKFRSGVNADIFISILQDYARKETISEDIREDLGDIKEMLSSNEQQQEQNEYIPPEVWRGMTKNELLVYIDTISRLPQGNEFIMATVGSKSRLIKTKVNMMNFLQQYDDEIRSAFLNPSGNTNNFITGGRIMSGKGLGRPKSRNYEGSLRPKRSDNIKKEDIDYSKGISYVSPRFVPIGKYIINKGQLDKNIISMKTKSGGCICGFKSQRTTAKMGEVLRKIIGGSIPSFDEIQTLDNSEKAYLHKVASASGIIDKLSIPAPDKSAEDKEIDNFELMKGQILSGNDNKDYIKKFKLLVMKLSKNDLLPMRQAKEVLYELAMLGY